MAVRRGLSALLAAAVLLGCVRQTESLAKEPQGLESVIGCGEVTTKLCARN